jgi:hypothetical protein
VISAASTPRSGTTAARVVLTLVGAVLMIVGAFMDWVDRIGGTSLSWKAFYTTSTVTTKGFLMTVGAVFILLGLLGILGLAEQTGWLTRTAGALGIIGFALIAIQLYRAHSQGLSALMDRVEVGAWIALAGSFVLLIAGFLAPSETAVSE